jgi:hypothetical protein
MKKFYILIPLVIVALFAVYYVSWNKQAEAKARTAAEARLKTEAEEKRVRDEFLRAQVEEAKIANEQKLREIEAKRAKREAERELIARLEEELAQSEAKRDTLYSQLYDIQTQLRDEQDLQYRAGEKIKRLNEEELFLKQYLPVSRENVGKARDFLKRAQDYADQKAREAAAAVVATKTK